MAGEFHCSVTSLESTLLNVVSRRRIIQESAITPIHHDKVQDAFAWAQSILDSSCYKLHWHEDSRFY